VLNVVINMFPPVFRLHPDYSVKLNTELMDSATRTGTAVSADDFVYHLRQHRRQRHPGGPVLELQPLGPEGHLAAAPRMLPGETLRPAGAGWGIFRGHPGWWRCRRRSRLLGTIPDFEEPT
jgi:hypothetical protein